MLKVAVVILNWNGQKILNDYLPSVVKYSRQDNVGIYFVDNGSTDASLQLIKENYPSIKILDLKENHGFAGGYNLAIQHIEAEYIVLLNSDVEVTENWLQPQIDFLDANNEVAACQPKIRWSVNKDSFEYAGACGGYIDKFIYPFCRGRVMSTLEQDYGQYDTVEPIFWASGAALFIRREVFLQVGGFDTRFFAHMEEIDLCWRIWSRGHKIVVIPQSIVYHYGGATLSKSNPKKTYLNFRNNLLMAYKNLNDKRLKVVEQRRFFLDYIAILFYIVKGEFSNAKAVKRARRDYSLMKKDFDNDRKLNLSLTKQHPLGVLNKSLIWSYYFERKKKFSSFNVKDFNTIK